MIRFDHGKSDMLSALPSPIARQAFAVVTAVVLVTAFVACDPTVTIWLENGTTSPITVEGIGAFTIGPRATIGVQTIDSAEGWPIRIRAFSQAGELIFEGELATREESAAVNHEIVIAPAARRR